MHFNHLNAHDSGKLGFIFYTIGDEPKFYYTEYDENLNRFGRRTRINLKPPYKNYSILASCNGLVFFGLVGFHGRFHNGYICICNPITGERIVLPQVGDARNILTGFGFGYCASTNEYKVVTIRWGTVLGYTLGSYTGWRYVENMDRDIIPGRKIGEFLNGAIHWVDQKGTIFAFDLADEEFHALPSSPCLLKAGNPPYVARLGEFLCAIYENGVSRDIWILKNYKNHEDVTWNNEFIRINAEPITFIRSGKVLGYRGLGRIVYRCDLKASSSKVRVKSGMLFQRGVPHRNTLVSLEGLGAIYRNY
ncbi:F-box/kelch-repeat protein At3g23880-like [Papaver somniferum]|uniref:F-box/kelch-repeat protein At3g23880-like n=1 Tax=Papaver somniferum TaxID=3469 RepID=UPI000E703A36|nr:F-box/kelch-repeat protein At3g23880-like [Papaver somniferum]